MMVMEQVRHLSIYQATTHHTVRLQEILTDVASIFPFRCSGTLVWYYFTLLQQVLNKVGVTASFQYGGVNLAGAEFGSVPGTLIDSSSSLFLNRNLCDDLHLSKSKRSELLC